MNLFAELPDEIIEMIFRNCDFPTFKALRKVNHQFHRVSNIDSLWKSETEKIIHDNYNEFFLNRDKKEPLLQFSPEIIEDCDNAHIYKFSPKGFKETYRIYKTHLLQLSKCKSTSFDIFDCFCDEYRYRKSYKICSILMIPFFSLSVISMIFGLVTLHIAGYNCQSSMKVSGFFYMFTTAGSFFFLGFILYFPLLFYLIDFTFLQLFTIVLFPTSILCFSVFADGLGVEWLCLAGIPELLLLILAPFALEIYITGKEQGRKEMKARFCAYLCIFIKLVGFVLNVLKKDAGWDVPWSVAAAGNYLYFAVGAFYFWSVGNEFCCWIASRPIFILHIAAEIVQILCALWADGIVKPFALVLLPVDLCLLAYMFYAPLMMSMIISGDVVDFWENAGYDRITENKNREYRRVRKKMIKISKSLKLELDRC